MKKQILYIIIACSLPCLFTACGKSSGGGTAAPSEEKLAATLSAAAIENSPSSSFPFTVNIQSKLPTGGVTIKVDVIREDTNAGVYNITANSSFASSNFTVSNLPPGQIYCRATITITSVSTASNTWTGSFRVLWK